MEKNNETTNTLIAIDYERKNCTAYKGYAFRF